jgi:hypothetical protein
MGRFFMGVGRGILYALKLSENLPNPLLERGLKTLYILYGFA